MIKLISASKSKEPENKQITSDKQYKDYLQRIETLLDEVNTLSLLVEAYEDKHYPIENIQTETSN